MKEGRSYLVVEIGTYHPLVHTKIDKIKFYYSILLPYLVLKSISML